MRRTYTQEEMNEAAELYGKGIRIVEISKIMGIPYNTLYCWLSGMKSKEKGFNADRHLCKSCVFRLGSQDRHHTGGNCDYIEVVGKIRGCKVSECDKYIKGKKIQSIISLKRNKDKSYAEIENERRLLQ